MTQPETIPSVQDDPLLTWSEVCAQLRIGRTKLWELRQDKQLVPEVSYPSRTGIKARLRWRQSAVDAYVRASTIRS